VLPRSSRQPTVSPAAIPVAESSVLPTWLSCPISRSPTQGPMLPMPHGTPSTKSFRGHAGSPSITMRS